MLDRAASILGDTSTEARTFLATSFDQQLHALFDLHDWSWKHKAGTFNTVASTEIYDIAVSATDLRTSEDLEVLYDKTNGTFLRKVDVRDIKKFYPKEDQINKSIAYGAWGTTSIYMHPIPDGIYTMMYMYIAKAKASATDADTLTATLGVPDFMFYLFEKMFLAEAMLYFDDARRNSILEEVSKIWLPKAIQADMKHLENTARFKFWEEEIRPRGLSFNDFLRQVWWGNPMNY